MSDLFLAQMGDFFMEGVCFDTSTEGNGGPSGGVPHCAKVSAAWLCGIGPGLKRVLGVLCIYL
jgi:hypothetical protein